jgi:DNA polymerase-3 subunit epsilon
MGLEKGNSDCFSAHLDICRAACTGAEAPASYNNRVMRAFTAKGIRSWPFPGPILIEEKNGSTEGDAFLIDQWCIVGSCKFDETGAEKFLPAGYIFDYDSYKILVQFLLSPKKPAPLKQLTYSDLRGLLEKFNSA